MNIKQVYRLELLNALIADGTNECLNLLVLLYIDIMRVPDGRKLKQWYKGWVLSLRMWHSCLDKALS